MNILNIIFWEPSYSPHKTQFFDSVGSLLKNCSVKAYAHSDIPKDRLSQGWKIDDNTITPWILQPTNAMIRDVVAKDPKNTLHIFSGIRWVPTLIIALSEVKKTKARFAIMSEPRVGDGVKGTLRFIQSWLTEGWLRRNAEFILAIGRNGPPWFKSVGYNTDKIFAFAYFVNSPTPLGVSAEWEACDKAVRVGYVGRIVQEKGVFDLVRAIKILGTGASLSIVGGGSDKNALIKLTKALCVAADFAGVLPIAEVGKAMARFDVLVLASTTKDDGWGVVVSEALMCGTAIISTNHVGASLLLEEPLFGRCVPSCDPQAIANAILELQASGAFTSKQRQARRMLASARLSAEAGARYLAEIINWTKERGLRPTPFNKYEVTRF